VIWLVAALALKFGSRWNVENHRTVFLVRHGRDTWWPWPSGPSGACVRERSGRDHDETKTLVHPDGKAPLSVFEDGVPPRFRVPVSGTLRAGFAQNGSTGRGHPTLFLRATPKPLDRKFPEPHEFKVEVTLKGPSGEQTVATQFAEHHHIDEEDDNAHAREHAEQIQRRFAGREVTTGRGILLD
jgi:nickel/cobalt exporter